MLTRRSLTVLVGVLAVLVAVVVLLVTASTDSPVGRTRAQLGDAVKVVGDAITVPSPTPTPTVDPVTAADLRSGIAAAETRRLLTLVERDLGSRSAAARAAAVKSYNSAIESLKDVVPGSDPATYTALYEDMSALYPRIKAVVAALSSPTASPAGRPS